MNLSQYIKSRQCKIVLAIESTEFNSYIEVHNNFIINTDKQPDVIIDKVLDVFQACAIDNHNVKIETIINVCEFFRGDYYKIIPGSFIGENVIDDKNTHFYDLPINGYVMHNGVLS